MKRRYVQIAEMKHVRGALVVRTNGIARGIFIIFFFYNVALGFDKYSNLTYLCMSGN